MVVSEMEPLPKRKMRLLYLLALAQLVGGPLVLLQLTVLCKLTLHETPRMGLAQAATNAWHSDEFQSVLAAGTSAAAGESKNLPQPRDPKADPEKAKPPMLPWEPGSLARLLSTGEAEPEIRGKFWTPGWPHAPPAPPPRMG
jgi:hypothetical protein